MRYVATMTMLCVLEVAASSVANGAIQTYVDIDRHNRCMSSCSPSYTWTHNVATVEGNQYLISGYPAGNGTWTDAGGFLPGVDELSSPGTGAYLDIWVNDDRSDCWHESEKFRLNVDDFTSGIQNASLNFFQVQATATIRADIQADGQLQFTIQRTSGDFCFDYSALVVNANRPAPTPAGDATPEPPTVIVWSVLAIGGWLGSRRWRSRMERNQASS